MRPDGTNDFQALQNFARRGEDDRPALHGLRPALPGWLRPARRSARRAQAPASAADAAPCATGSATRTTSRVTATSFFNSACDLQLEGVVSKRRDAPYRAGRGRDWVKTKCLLRQEFVVVGYTDPGGSRHGVRRARARRARGRRLDQAGRARGHRLHRRVAARHPRAPARARARRSRRSSTRPDGARRHEHPLGRAHARRRGRVRRVDRGRAAPAPVVPRAARGQVRRGGHRREPPLPPPERLAPGASPDEGRWSPIVAGVAADESGPRLLAGRRRHQARARALLRVGRRADAAARRGPPALARALPHRLHRRVLLPEAHRELSRMPSATVRHLRAGRRRDGALRAHHAGCRASSASRRWACSRSTPGDRGPTTPRSPTGSSSIWTRTRICRGRLSPRPRCCCAASSIASA